MSNAAPHTFICLAAGKGTRMGRLSSYLQKCMYPLDGLPFVEHTMREIASSSLFRPGETEFVFVVGHHAEQLSSYFGDEYEGATVRYARQEVAAGTAHAVQTGLDALSDPGQVMVWLGDAFFPAETFEALAEHPDRVAITLVEENDNPALHHRVDVENDRLVSTWRGSSPYVEAGLWKLLPEVMAGMRPSDDGEYRMLYVLEHYIEQRHPVGYVETPEWIQLGGGAPVRDRELLDAIARVSGSVRRTRL